jgi:hypothetical protein
MTTMNHLSLRVGFWVLVAMAGACSSSGSGEDKVDAATSMPGTGGTPVVAMDAAVDVAEVCVPSGAEICDGRDNDCSGAADEGLNCVNWAGRATDGDLTVSAMTVLGGPASKAPGFKLMSIAGTQLTVTTAPTGLNAGDEILILNLRGTTADSTSVGNWETAFVKTTQPGAQGIVLESPLRRTYGLGNSNTDLAGQIVLVQRVPHFKTVSVAKDARLTPAPGGPEALGGVMFFRATTVTVADAGMINANFSGYNGAPGSAIGRSGASGESITGGVGTVPSPDPNLGGGGGGKSNCDMDGCQGQSKGGGGGGGSFAADGIKGANNGGLHKGGLPGQSYGDIKLEKLFFGSGGGGGAGGSRGPLLRQPGGNGGGIIVIFADTVDAKGFIWARGQEGSTDLNCGLADGTGGGGGGAGGTIWLSAPKVDLVIEVFNVTGGSGACNGGGDGGYGRVRVDYKTAGTFAYDTDDAKDIITNASIIPPVGYTSMLP